MFAQIQISKRLLPQFQPKAFLKYQQIHQVLERDHHTLRSEIRRALNVPGRSEALVIMDVFTGQMTTEVLNPQEEGNVLNINFPANMTKFYQPLDLTVNGYEKQLLKSKFIDWYSSQVRAYLYNGVSIDSIAVGLQLSKINSWWFTRGILQSH